MPLRCGAVWLAHIPFKSMHIYLSVALSLHIVYTNRVCHFNFLRFSPKLASFAMHVPGAIEILFWSNRRRNHYYSRNIECHHVHCYRQK